ncbi:MAG: GHKL domain-containing protein [Lachnospiraceae bacterium]|nr:GHKL domain-containing protein [Lachnospiraceae bacterium]
MVKITIADILLALFMGRIIHTYISLFGRPQRNHPALQTALWMAYLCFLTLVTGADSPYPLGTLMGNILFMTLLYKLAHRADLKTSFFHMGVLGAAWMAVEVTVHSFLLFMTDDTKPDFMLGNVITQISVYIAVQAYGRFMPKGKAAPLPLRCWFELFIAPIVSVYVIYDAYRRSLEHGSGIGFVVVSLLMVFMNLIIFDVYERMISHTLAEKKNLVYEQEIEMCERQAKDREAAYRQTRMLRHDLNDRLIGIGALLESGRSDEAAEQISRMLEENRLHRDDVSHCGNLTLDALINYKHSLAAAKGIRVECRMEVPTELPADGTDLCIILGNLLDNALEAVEKLSEEQRLVKLAVRLEKGTLHIMVENPYNGKITENADGTIKSSKGSGELHGYGLVSVRKTVEKYAGDLVIRHEEGVFRASVILYPK